MKNIRITIGSYSAVLSRELAGMLAAERIFEANSPGIIVFEPTCDMVDEFAEKECEKLESIQEIKRLMSH